MSVAILIPAAGASSRMRGADKLMQQVDGHPLLRRTASRACAACTQVIVTLPTDSPRAEALAGLPVTVVTVDDPSLGMSQSLKLGAAQAGAASGLMVLPADMPDLTVADLTTVIAAFTQNPRLLRAATDTGMPGHPVVFPREYLPKFQTLSGDQGARPLLKGATIDLIPLPASHALTDLDTPEAWAEWRAAQASAD